MNVNQNIMIFSGFKGSNSATENVKAHEFALRQLDLAGVPHAELEGRYAGVDEKSILVLGFQHRGLVEELCTTLKQDCYLESHGDRSTFLVYPNGTKESIGQLVPVSQSEAEQLGAYSYSPDLKQYYVTR